MALRKQLIHLTSTLVKRQTLKDTIILYKIKDNCRSPQMTLVMEGLTLIGSGGAVWVLAGMNEMRYKKTRLAGFSMIATIGANIVVNNLVTKVLVNRKRPCEIYPEEYLAKALPLGASFPSGHTLNAFTGATMLTLTKPQNALWAFPLAAAIGFSRLYLFAHWPSDVEFGAVEGVIVGIAGQTFFRGLYHSDMMPLFNWFINKKTLTERREEKRDKNFEAVMGAPVPEKGRERARALKAYDRRMREEKERKKAKSAERRDRIIGLGESAYQIYKILKAPDSDYMVPYAWMQQ